MLAVALLAAGDLSRRRTLRGRAAAARSAEDRASAIRMLAGAVEQSQGLEEILPALAVQLSDELGLIGLSLRVSNPSGGDRELFVHGVSPDPTVRSAAGRDTHLASGETMAIELHRAERSVAVLRVVAGVPLDHRGIDLLHVAGEMITSTVISARSLEQQQEALTRLEELDELKTTFLGVASHELRTPATAISGLASVLAKRWDELKENDRRVFAQRIATNADSLNALVQDLLDFARLERGDVQLALEPVDLSVAVASVLDRLATVWDSHVINRRLEPQVWVHGDENALGRVVTNLVSNAVKFSPAGETITVTVARLGDRAALVIDDAGPGVPEHERKNIFVRFFRGSGDSVVRTRGVGIGLSVVSDFVDQMDGTVRVEAAPTGGARFVVELDAIDRLEATEEERDVAST